MTLDSWLLGYPTQFRSALRGCATGELVPAIALLNLAMIAESPAEMQKLVSDLQEPAIADAFAVSRLEQLRALACRHIDAPETIAAVLSAMGCDWQTAPDPRARLAELAAGFDRCAAVSPEASVALYSFGAAEQLAAVTQELVAQLLRWGVVKAPDSCLDIGCGIGRLEEALAPLVRHIVGIDISPVMIETAQRRCGHLANASFRRVHGAGLAEFRRAAFDRVFAIDCFPYLVDCGADVVATHFQDAARILKPAGHFVIVNFSYRGDLAADRRDVARLASQAGLHVERSGERSLANWDGTAFCLVKPCSSGLGSGHAPP